MIIFMLTSAGEQQAFFSPQLFTVIPIDFQLAFWVSQWMGRAWVTPWSSFFFF